MQLGRGTAKAPEEYAAEQVGNKTTVQYAHLCFLISSLNILSGFLPDIFVSISMRQFTFFFLTREKVLAKSSQLDRSLPDRGTTLKSSAPKTNK